MTEEEIRARITSLSIEQARKEIADGLYGDVRSYGRQVALSLLAPREAEEQDKRSNRTENISLSALRMAKWANMLSIIAITLSVIAIISSVVLSRN